jgi:hypothetical protein
VGDDTDTAGLPCEILNKLIVPHPYLFSVNLTVSYHQHGLHRLECLGMDIVGSGRSVGAFLEALRKTFISGPGFESMTRRIRNEVSTEILKDGSLHVWRVCHVFAMSLLFVAECVQVLIEVSS